MYEIIGVCRGKKRVIDKTGDLEEARYLVEEFRMANGPEWTIYYKKQENNFPRKLKRLFSL